MSDNHFLEDDEDNIIDINKEDLADEQPLNTSEEEKLKKIKEDRVIEKLTTLRDRVLSIKRVIEEDQFIEIFVKPIRGNIEEIKIFLETADKPRDIALSQGKLKAYRGMLNFPDTACSALAQECLDIERELPLFYGENDLIKSCRKFRWDHKKYKIYTDYTE